ncbi:hypothetical protein M422DRAFT_191655, partial [Sphaerobolus stellatus SS14]
SNELNAPYAADGYAIVGQAVDSDSLGVVKTTFGVGELSGINGIAGAFSEHIPILDIAGVPSTTQLKTRPVLYHTLGDGRYSGYVNLLSSSKTPTLKHMRCFQARPVYMTFPTDLVYEKIFAAPLRTPLNLDSSNADVESYVLNEIVRLVSAAGGNVAFLVDACAVRHHVVGEVRELVSAAGFPVYSAPMDKSIIAEDYEHFGEVYLSSSRIVHIPKTVESAKLIISLGSLQTDFNTGNFTYHLTLHAIVEV